MEEVINCLQSLNELHSLRMGCDYYSMLGFKEHIIIKMEHLKMVSYDLDCYAEQYEEY